MTSIVVVTFVVLVGAQAERFLDFILTFIY